MVYYAQVILPRFSLSPSSLPACELLHSHVLLWEASPEPPGPPPDHTFPCANLSLCYLNCYTFCAYLIYMSIMPLDYVPVESRHQTVFHTKQYLAPSRNSITIQLTEECWRMCRAESPMYLLR